ncbi:hypothetical protein E4U03_12310 [Rothia nasimurium]|uniref:Uncharacterized protein n=1 Tax=Rothia nasimurium TaxID=85336 RepID=A0A4Y9F2J7_9MICC|nr:hypothetical protein [Rothia nasimurium]MBF0809379.1 hypothetical protein [Rothia nasimurium]TFU19583.1 hypothetical protein E4U03_12310 [Rothia nasimurium]
MVSVKVKKIATSLAVAGIFTTGVMASPAYADDSHITESSIQLVGENKDKWEALSDTERNQILETINHPDFRIGMTQEEASKISPDLQVVGTEEIKDSQGSYALSRVTASSDRHEVTSQYTEKTSQLGIELGWNKIEYKYVTGNNQVLETRSCVGTYNQIVPYRNVNVSTNHWLDNGEGICTADWSVARLGGIGGTENWEQGMKVNGPGIKEKWFFKK